MEPWLRGALRRIAVAHTFCDRRVADASLVVLAERHQTNDILTLDERHFRAVSGPDGRPFRVLPADV